MLEHLPAPAQVGKTKVGGIDLNKARMRFVVEALIALSPSRRGFSASELARQVRLLSQQADSDYTARHAAYDLKKLRGKQIVRPIENSRRYEPRTNGFKAMAALLVLRTKPSNHSWPLLRAFISPAEPRTPNRSINTTTRFASQCRGSFRNLASPLEHRQ